MASSYISIIELAGAKRSLYLKGAALPKHGAANWGGKQRVVTTWYPGNGGQASQQILGPTESQTRWTGEWNTNRIIRTPAKLVDATREYNIFSADDIRATIEDILRAGSLLEVVWGYDPERVDPASGIDLRGTYNPVRIVREGRALEWDFQYTTGDDIEWTITWDWQSRGTQQQQVAEFRDGGSSTKNTLTSMLLMTEAAGNIAEDNIVYSQNRTVPLGANTFSLGQLLAIADGVKRQMRLYSQAMNALSSRIADVAAIINTVKAMPIEAVNHALDVANNMVASSNRLYDSVTRTPPELYDAQKKLASLTRAFAFAKTGTDASSQTASTGADSVSTLSAQIQAQQASGEQGNAQAVGVKPLRGVGGTTTQTQVHIVRRGETLISISVVYYGTPEGSADIAYANGLSLRTATLPIGRVIIIPPARNYSANVIGTPRAPLQPSANQSATQPNGVGSTTSTP